MADSAFPVLGSPENWALQYSQIPSTGTFLTRFTIRRLRLGMDRVSHRAKPIASLWKFKLHHYPAFVKLDISIGMKWGPIGLP
jgi:hypothetical protein